VAARAMAARAVAAKAARRRFIGTGLEFWRAGTMPPPCGKLNPDA
jgi:hypothetical protein